MQKTSLLGLAQNIWASWWREKGGVWQGEDQVAVQVVAGEDYIVRLDISLHSGHAHMSSAPCTATYPSTCKNGVCLHEGKGKKLFPFKIRFEGKVKKHGYRGDVQYVLLKINKT